jgi:histidinol-phosphate/aromatic aminotransferase/cobyric acid decarboxylase-like protein
MAIEPQPRGTGYVTHEHVTHSEHGPIINLGLGTSPIGAAPELKDALSGRNTIEDLEAYPCDPLHTETKGYLVNYLGIEASTSQVIFGGNGSYGTGDEVLRYLRQSHGCDRIVTLPYSFPNATQWAIRHGVDYSPIKIDSLSWEKGLESMYEIESFDGAVVYIDYPNNPSGNSQSLLVSGLIPLINQRGGIPFIDMAFAEVLGQEFKAVANTTINNGGIIIGSVSKTQGLPGLRAGWIVLAEEHTNNGYSLEQQLVFGMNREAEEVMKVLYSPSLGTNETLADIHARRVAQHNVIVNLEMEQIVREMGLLLVPSDHRTSIQVVYDPAGRNLYQSFNRAGVTVESLQDYSGTLPVNQQGYGDSAVRILTPNFSKLDAFFERTKVVLSYLHNS